VITAARLGGRGQSRVSGKPDFLVWFGAVSQVNRREVTLVSTLTQIAASYEVQPIELAILVGIGDVDPHAELTPEQTALVLNRADGSDFFGPGGRGRHRFR